MFEIHSSKRIFHANDLPDIFEKQVEGSLPYVVRATQNNGVRGYVINDEQYANEGNTLSFAQDTFTVFYHKEKYFTGNKVKVLIPLFANKSEKVMRFIAACFQQSLSPFTWGTGSTVDTIAETPIQLPTKNGQIDFDFMESIIAELEAWHIAELEAYLSIAGLKDYILTKEEEKALEEFKTLNWSNYDLENLFGKATRGKRLKSEDRIPGDLPFVTAGEACEGVSAYIGNEVEIFERNTTTIDMFGSAKYRNYRYGADDHVAVVHTEKLPEHAAIFVTTSIHKSSNTGKFDYSRNFYAKDADELDILLPTKEGKPDYLFMATFVSAVQKIVIKNVVLYVEEKLTNQRQLKNIKRHGI